MAGTIAKLQSVLIWELDSETANFPGLSSTRFFVEIWEIGPGFFGYLLTPERRFYFLRQIGFPSAQTALSAARTQMAAVTGGRWSQV